jgi:outer membrane biosynthesis protein TonB
VTDSVRSVQLRASLVWRDEVMGDVVLTKPRALTIGTSPKCTFVVPDLGLPPKFSIIKPGNRGYLLTLGNRMRGTIQVDGGEKDVEEFVARGGEGDLGATFRATPIGGRDWGVVDLDDSGDYKLFFQFVPVEAPLPKLKMGRYREVAAIGTVILGLAIAFPSYATIIILAAMLGTALFEIVLGFLFAEDDDFTRPAIAFSILLFAFLLGVAFTFKSDDHPWVPPGPRELTAGYLVERLAEPPPEPEPEPEKKGPVASVPAAAKDGEKEKSKAATKREAGKSGGQGEKRAMEEDGEDDATPPPPDKGLMTGNNRKQIDRTLEIDNLPALDRYANLKGPKQDGQLGMGKGTGYGVGDDLDGTGTRKGHKGKGRGGGGSAEGDFESTGDPDMKEARAPKGSGGTGSGVKEAKVAFSQSDGDFTGGLTREEVDRVVKSRKGTIQACYQKAVNRDRSLAGKLVVNFRISAEGKVTSARIEPGKSSLRNAEVESCVKRQIQGLKFPAKGGAVVNYPFIFSSG